MVSRTMARLWSAVRFRSIDSEDERLRRPMSVETESHDWMFPKADTGCIVLADISGYTPYLEATELEHAQDVLTDLIETVASSLKQVLSISHLEGDAVLAYALDEDVEGSMLLDAVEETYFAFRSRRRDVTHATTCNCQACARIPNLDLKFITHHGRFARASLEGKIELTGHDVNVAHRLLKNEIKERFGTGAYHFVTEACVDKFGMDPDALSMHSHEETYEDVGLLRGYVSNLHEQWRYDQERRRVFVVPSEAHYGTVQQYPAPPAVVWEYLNSPVKRLEWQTNLERVDQNNPAGRQGVGTTNHCVHGKAVVLEEILDWRPFRYVTKRLLFSKFLGPTVNTMELRPVGESSTEVHHRGRLEASGLRRAIFKLMRPGIESRMRKEDARLEAALERRQTAD